MHWNELLSRNITEFFYDNQDGVLDPFTGYTLLLTMIRIINNIVNIDKITQNISLDNVYCWERQKKIA